MVTYKLTGKSETHLEFAYYPAGDEEKRPGRIVANLEDGCVSVAEEAEADERIVERSAEELNAMRDAANRKRREKGKQELTEEEWPTETGSQIIWKYADPVMQDISRRMLVPQGGTDSCIGDLNDVWRVE